VTVTLSHPHWNIGNHNTGSRTEDTIIIVRIPVLYATAELRLRVPVREYLQLQYYTGFPSDSLKSITGVFPY